MTAMQNGFKNQECQSVDDQIIFKYEYSLDGIKYKLCVMNKVSIL